MTKILATLVGLGLVFSLFSDDISEPVRVVLVHRQCGQMVPLKDNTNIITKCLGEMKLIAGSGVLTSYPPQYQHACTVCGRTANYFEVFPSIQYEAMPSGTNIVRNIGPKEYIQITNGLFILK